MKRYKLTVSQMTADERQRAAYVIGETVLMAEEMRTLTYMGEKLNLYPEQVYENISETLYQLRRKIGRWEYFKILFMK